MRHPRTNSLPAVNGAHCPKGCCQVLGPPDLSTTQDTVNKENSTAARQGSAYLPIHHESDTTHPPLFRFDRYPPKGSVDIGFPKVGHMAYFLLE